MKKTLLSLALLSPAFASADVATDGCVACHKDVLSLKGKETAAIAARLKDMRDERARHPTPLPRMTDAEIDALARELTAR